MVASESASDKNGSAAGVLSPEMAAEYQKMVQLLKQKDEELRVVNAKLYADEIRRAQQLKDVEERSRDAQMKMKVEADKMAITVKELEDADGQNGLRRWITGGRNTSSRGTTRWRRRLYTTGPTPR